ncbi:MAG: GAF domain-containing protein, partial [Byssovorax sp.]
MLDLEVTTAAEASRMRRLRKLTHVSRMLTHATSLDQVLSLTVTEAALLLEGSRAALLLYDPSGCLQVRATHAVTGAVLRSELETPDTSLEQILRAVLGEGFESNAVAVPLIVSGKVTGALAVIRGESAISEEEEEWLLSALADQTMVAIEKERLDEIQGRAEQQALIARVGHRLLQRHDVQGLFDEISSSVSATLGIDLVGIFGRQPEGTFALLGGVGWSTPHPAPTTMEHGRTSWESHAFGSNNPVAFGATDADDRASSEAFLRDPRVTSGLVVAIEPPSKYGVLGVYSRTPREFSHEERDVLASLATLLSSALEREAAETQLRAAAEMRDDLLAIVSHDLRGPLFAIISAA